VSGRSARARRRPPTEGGQQTISTASLPERPAEAPPPPPTAETVRTVIDAVGALERMGDTAFDNLLTGYSEVVAAKGPTVAYAWLAYNLERHAGPTAIRAIAAAGVLRAHAATVPDPARGERVAWLRWAVNEMAMRYGAVFNDGGAVRARRGSALYRLTAALAREAL
jgi:hypothetical protein